ncbi:MAG: hypothetical protein LBB53_06635 [Prevotellaceae bacterium]|jgi:hypothetical protein|nr:hypothetical protein [Prevotellaceae bacterium]
MEMYFITTRHTLPVNKKCKAAVEYCKKFDKILAINRSAIDAMHAELKLMCATLNEKFPKSRKIYVDWLVYSDAFIIKNEEDVHNSVFQIYFTRVLGTYEFLEQLTPTINH